MTLLCLSLLVIGGCSGDVASDVAALLLTPDQQAQRLYADGKFEAAASLFTQPMRRGISWYRAGEFKNAAAEFGRVSSVEGLFNRGNGLLMQGDYEGAIETYEAVLETRPEWEAAIVNLDVAKARWFRLQSHLEEQSQSGEVASDEALFGNRAKSSDRAAKEKDEEPIEVLSDAALRAQWLRRVQTEAKDFLRAKFLYQHKRAQAAGEFE